MTKPDKERLTAILHQTAGVYDKPLTKSVVALWLNILDGFGIDAIADAFTTHIKTQRWFPRPAEILEQLEARQLAPVDRATNMAATIIAWLRTNGAKKFPQGLDGTAERLMRTRWDYYTWGSVVIDAELNWWAKDFIAAYQAEAAAESYGWIEAPDRLKNLAENATKRIEH
jgi:hypothetical protein